MLFAVQKILLCLLLHAYQNSNKYTQQCCLLCYDLVHVLFMLVCPPPCPLGEDGQIHLQFLVQYLCTIQPITCCRKDYMIPHHLQCEQLMRDVIVEAVSSTNHSCMLSSPVLHFFVSFFVVWNLFFFVCNSMSAEIHLTIQQRMCYSNNGCQFSFVKI